MAVDTLLPMEPPDPVSTLSDDDLLSLTIGRVVRAHARVEYGLRNVHEVLGNPSSPDNMTAGFVGVERLVKDCIVRLRRTDIGRELAANWLVTAPDCRESPGRNPDGIRRWHRALR